MRNIEIERWRILEIERWGNIEIERWENLEIERWRILEIERWGKWGDGETEREIYRGRRVRVTELFRDGEKEKQLCIKIEKQRDKKHRG